VHKYVTVTESHRPAGGHFISQQPAHPGLAQETLKLQLVT